jgi:hypothetical protein
MSQFEAFRAALHLRHHEEIPELVRDIFCDCQFSILEENKLWIVADTLIDAVNLLRLQFYWHSEIESLGFSNVTVGYPETLKWRQDVGRLTVENLQKYLIEQVKSSL